MEDIAPHGFEQLIAWRTGLQMREGDKEKWRSLINARLNTVRLQSLGEYYRLLTSAADAGKSEWRELMTILTTGESYFFRDKGQFSLLKNLILPELIECRQKDRTLRIWSAGCSTGEEPYSLAILIDEMRNTELVEKIPHSALRTPHLKDWDILILGTDINEKAIEKARQGIYSQWSFRMTDPDLRKRYFKRRRDAWEIDERILQMVTLRTGNLMENSFPDKASGLCDIDLILCRNVFIYFNSVSVAVVLGKFIETLNDEGWLVTGHGELYGQSLGRLKARMFPESVVYQKTAECGVLSAELKEKPNELKIESRIQEPEFRIRRQESKITGSEFIIPDSKEDSALRTLHSALEDYILMARKYADSGQYDRAVAECRKALDIDITAVMPYFLLAHISEIKGNTEEAKELFKRVIYLDPAFAPAYLELGSLYEREYDSGRALKMRTTAGELLKKMPPDSVVEPYEGVTAGELLEYVKKMV